MKERTWHLVCDVDTPVLSDNKHLLGITHVNEQRLYVQREPGDIPAQLEGKAITFTFEDGKRLRVVTEKNNNMRMFWGDPDLGVPLHSAEQVEWEKPQPDMQVLLDALSS